MQDHITQTSTPARREAGQTESAILLLLLASDNQRPWSVAELEREVGDLIETADALGSLHAAGLVHRFGKFVFPTRAAVCSDELAL